MPRGSGGTCTKAQADVIADTPILASWANAMFDDVNTTLTDSLSRTGKGGMQANLDMGSTYKIVNLANGTAATDAATIGQLPIPAGTKMPFYQASPPVGWVADYVQNDSMMRVVTPGTTGGTYSVGGGHSPIINDVVSSHVHPVSITSGNNTHTHYTVYDDTVEDTSLSSTRPIAAIGNHLTGDTNMRYALQSINSTTLVANKGPTSSNTHNHTVSGNTSVNSGATDWRPRYIDFCIGEKS